MRNEELIRCFEADALPGDGFHHQDHVRLAFAYLCEYPPLEALAKFAAALQRFATARGKPQLYNETITHAYFFLIRERMARFPGCEWDEFADRNPDLLRWKDGILGRYYRESKLQSELYSGEWSHRSIEFLGLPSGADERCSGARGCADRGEHLRREWESRECHRSRRRSATRYTRQRESG